MCRYKHEQTIDQYVKDTPLKVIKFCHFFLEECIKLITLLINMAATNDLLKSILQSRFSSLATLISFKIVLSRFFRFKYLASGN